MRRASSLKLLAVPGVLAGCCVAPAMANDAFRADRQAANLALSASRGSDLTPQVLSAAAVVAARRSGEHRQLQAADPERRPDPNFCTTQACVGDPRLDAWDEVVEPVLFTARTGATLSGHVWATRSGPKLRPGVVIVNGSVLAFEEMFLWAAQTLARAGFVVLTFDIQGEGRSDQYGEPPDQLESQLAGTPPISDGGAFYDGATDAIDFLLSRPERPYLPRPSRTSGTSHAGKQKRRVALGLNAPYNPLHDLVANRGPVGLAGHSFGAIAASYIAQADHRVGALVAWDGLCVPVNATDHELALLGAPGAAALFGVALPTAAASLSQRCFGAPPQYRPTVPLRTPALGLSGDYLLPMWHGQPIERDYKAVVVDAYTRAGVDSANIVIRGGNHADFTWLPAPLGSLRGIDLSAWYTAAWFDRYLRDDPTADRRMLTDRWRHDAATARVDPRHDENLLSQWWTSRIAMHTRDGRSFRCDDLRNCDGLVPASRDCGPAAAYDHRQLAWGRMTTRRTCPAESRVGCNGPLWLVFRLPLRLHRHGVVRLRVRANGRAVRVRRTGRRLSVRLRAARPPSRIRLHIKALGDDRRWRTAGLVKRVCGR